MNEKDPREFIRVHNAMPDHPKIELLSDAAFRLLLSSWCWCSRHRTDGLIKRELWARRSSPKARRELVDAGLVVIRDGGDAQMHDYLKHQRSKAEIESFEAVKSDGGKLGAHRKWHVARGLKVAGCEFCVPNGSAHDTAITPPIGQPIAAPITQPIGAPVGDGVGDGVANGCKEEEEEVDTKDTPAPAARPILTKRLEAPFAAFWAAYPRKIGKLDAQRRFLAAVKVADPQLIVTGAVRYAKASRGKEAQYIAHPATWLHRGSWADQDDQSAPEAIVSTSTGGW